MPHPHDKQQPTSKPAEPQHHEVKALSDIALVELDSLGYEGAFPYLSTFEPELEAC